MFHICYWHPQEDGDNIQMLYFLTYIDQENIVIWQWAIIYKLHN